MTPRPITPADIPAIQALHRQVGWPARTSEGWRWLHGGPRQDASDTGWVVDGPSGRPAAHLGNLVQCFQLGQRSLRAATGHSIIVSPVIRGASRALLQTFVRQPDVFATYTLNANRMSQPLYARHGMRPWPDATHATKLSWVVDPIPLALSRAMRAAYRLMPERVGGWSEQLQSHRQERAITARLPRGVTLLSDFRDASPYAAFWARLSQEPRLLADRSPETLRWRLADPDLTLRPVTLAFHDGHDITGWAMAQLCKANTLEAPVLEIIDLDALAAEPRALPALMEGLFAAARNLGAAKLRLQVASPRLIERLGGWMRWARREGGWGHAHIRLADDAPDLALWTPTPFDGDYAMCLRPPPLATAARMAPATSAKAQS